MRREHLDHLLAMARDIQQTGGSTMDFNVFSTEKIDAYAEQAKRTWEIPKPTGNTRKRAKTGQKRKAQKRRMA